MTGLRLSALNQIKVCLLLNNYTDFARDAREVSGTSHDFRLLTACR